MRARIPMPVRAVVLAAAALLLPGCIEADVQTEVREDGSGSLGVSMKLTEKFIEVMRRMESLDPKKAGRLASDLAMPIAPDDATRAELEKAGLKVLECAGVNSEKEVSARIRLEFKDLAALQHADRLENRKAGKVKSGGGGPGDDLWLSRDEKGLYTLLLDFDPTTSDDDDDDDEEEPAADGEDGGDEAAGDEKEPEDPEEAAKKMQEGIKMMGELMAEAMKLKFVVGLKVPGEVVEYAPKAGAKVDGSKVTWTMDFGTMTQMAMEGGFRKRQDGDADGEDADGDMKFKVVFRMPEGKSLPDSALRAPKAAEPKPEPKAPVPAGPDAPVPPAPADDE